MDLSELETKVRNDFHKITECLIKNSISITTMESITSGLIASFITDTEGSSSVFKGSYVTYSNEAKIMNGVSREIIDTYSVYSIETSADMARACRQKYNADLGIGITGTAGNVDPSNADASVPGEVYFAIDYNGSIHSKKVSLPAMPSRYLFKLSIASKVADELLSVISSN